MYQEIIPKLYLIKTGKPSCQSYLILGDKMNVLIDPGINQNFEILKKDLQEIGTDINSLSMVINTHEHVDHFGANIYLQEKMLITTHRYAASKIVSADDEVLLCRDMDMTPMAIMCTCG
jgi:glyoxylase-like metal-dependent hydrolase (beta-lactamase superfamily II)